MSSAVTMEGVRFSYKDQAACALDGINLELGEGEFVVVMGPSGAGKSTLCCTMNGLIPHFLRGKLEGRVTVLGKDTRQAKVSQLARDVGLVFQDFETQLFSTNVELEVAFGPENFGLPRKEIAARVREALATVRLSGMERRQPMTLSGGQKQRLAIASVLSLAPWVVCMDEPTTDLDPIGKHEVFDAAARLRAARDVTMVIVEHETEEALAADRLLVMQGGRISRQGSPREVLADADALEEAGIQPLHVVRLFRDLGEEQVPFTVDEALDFMGVRGWRLDEQAYGRLLEGKGGPARDDPIIEVRGLHHRYPNGVTALDGIDLTVREGEFLAVVGQNGSGKTTLVKHFNGLLLPTEGRVVVGGRDTARAGVLELSRLVGYVFQNPDHQIFADTVFDEVAFGPRNFGVWPQEVRQRVEEALAAVGLAGCEGADPFTLTKGERQRVAVASVLATRPRVIILDEPTTGLDYREQRGMMELIRKLNQDGHTIIVVTHTMWVVAEYAHRVVVMKDGRVMFAGPTREVFSHEEELTRAFLRPPQIVRLGNRLGHPLLTVAEARACLVKGGDDGGRLPVP